MLVRCTNHGSAASYTVQTSTTRDRLLARARELFDEHGLEAVGVRDLARDLGLSPGNISYHFPRKEDLVAALMEELAERNAATVADLARASDLTALLTTYRELFAAQLDHSFIGRSLVHIVDSYPALGERYLRTERQRRLGLGAAILAMAGGDLRADVDDAELARTVGAITLVARFWTSERRLSFGAVDDGRVVDHYLALVAQALWPLTTAAGRVAILPFLDGILVDETLGRA